MNKSINQKFKKNIIVVSIIITIVFLVINVALYMINNNYLVHKVEEENNAFLQLTTHLINENDISIALEYVEHYTHIHKVEIEILDDQDTMIFSSNVAHLYSSRHEIETLQGSFTVFIDNTESVTVASIEKNTIYVNISLVVIYVFALLILIRNNKITSKEIDQDISNVLNLIDHKHTNHSEFNHSEFELIYNIITRYLENIDLLTEQKSMNMKGLAHDIKTPLTLVYSYFERIRKDDKPTVKETQATFAAAVRINELLNDIIDDTKRKSVKVINISNILNEKIEEYSPIFKNKNISIVKSIVDNVTFSWSEIDFVRVMDNVISNAYYYSKDFSVFEIHLRDTEGLQIVCMSTPISIEDITIDTIFNKGVRGTSSSDKNNYGKGYGLYLCRLLLSTIEGSIQAEIVNENVKFTINL